MQAKDTLSTSGDLNVAVNDLGPLAWVLDELRKSLDGAAKALKRFVREAEAAKGSDLATLDASQLRIARQWVARKKLCKFCNGAHEKIDLRDQN